MCIYSVLPTNFQENRRGGGAGPERGKGQFIDFQKAANHSDSQTGVWK